MTITKINSRASLRGVQAIVIADKGLLATLLGDTEGPAHEDWDTSAERPDRVWKTWKGRISFVRRIVDTLVEVVTPPATEPDFDLLSDFFSIERASGAQRQRKVGEEVNSKIGGLIEQQCNQDPNDGNDYQELDESEPLRRNALLSLRHDTTVQEDENRTNADELTSVLLPWSRTIAPTLPHIAQLVNLLRSSAAERPARQGGEQAKRGRKNG